MNLKQFFAACGDLVDLGWKAEVWTNGLVVFRSPRPELGSLNHWDPTSAVWQEWTRRPRTDLESDFKAEPRSSKLRYAPTAAADELGVSRTDLGIINRVSCNLRELVEAEDCDAEFLFDTLGRPASFAF
ncbi:MAG: hypothetical protein V4467_02330 [Patescibacteria group bacterium]